MRATGFQQPFTSVGAKNVELVTARDLHCTTCRRRRQCDSNIISFNETIIACLSSRDQNYMYVTGG